MLLHIVCLILSQALQMGGASGGGSDGYFQLPVPDTFSISSLEREPGAPPGSSAFVRLNVGMDKSQTLVVRAFGLPDGTYDVVRIGSPATSTLGFFTVDGDGMGKLWPDPPEGGEFFDWYASGSWIDVRQNGVPLFHDYLPVPFGFILGGDDSTLFAARLVAVGDDLDARGRLSYRTAPGQISTDLQLERLAPGPYILEVDGEPVVYVEVGQNGKGRLRLSTPLQQGFGQAELFDPAGKFVRVIDAAGHAVLAAHMPQGKQSHPASAQKFIDLGEGAADGLRVDFVRSSWASLKSGWLAWQRNAQGMASLTVHLTDPSWSFWLHELYVGDTLIGTVQTPAADGNGLEDSFAVGPDIDLRGQRVEMRALKNSELALVFPQSVPAGLRAYHRDRRKPHHLHLDLLNPGIDLDATGLLDWRLKAGVETLQLVVRDLPAGAYDVVLDGSVVAPGLLVVDEDGGEDEVLLSTGGSVAGSTPLDFAVAGALEIRPAGSSAIVLQQALSD